MTRKLKCNVSFPKSNCIALNYPRINFPSNPLQLEPTSLAQLKRLLNLTQIQTPTPNPLSTSSIQIALASTKPPASSSITYSHATQLNPIRFIFVNFYGCLQLRWQMCPFSSDIFRVANVLLIHRLIACFDSIGHFYCPIIAFINYLSY